MIEHLESLIQEISVEKIENGVKKYEYIYKELPERVIQIIVQIIKSGKGEPVRYFNRHAGEYDGMFKRFVDMCYEKKIQPREFMINGVLTYRHLKNQHNVIQDDTYSVEYYE
jgi:hypothetical protein